MKHFILIIVCLCSSNLLNAQGFDFSSAQGTYRGEVLNGGDMDPFVTIFSLADDGRLKGEYSIDEGSSISQGTFSNFIVEGPYTLTMEWTDKDGEGLLQIEFTEDFQQFEGFWGTRDSPDKFQLNGKK